jgi:hypothetical protein|tara:strand:+ start:412 stop:534 length:123 start_codon:yes stop_codon:yes gene_type:complete
MAKKKKSPVTTKVVDKPDTVQHVKVEKKENPYAHTKIKKD